MKDITLKNWTDTEFKAYLFLYCALADHIEVKEERKHILSLIDREHFFAIHKEIEDDTDRQSLEKIKNHIKNTQYSKKQKEKIISDILSIFMSDGEFHKLEKGMFKTLNTLLTE